MFRFANPQYLWLLLLVPALTAIFFYGLILKKRRLNLLGVKSSLMLLMPGYSHWRPRVKFIISMVALSIAVFVAAGPQFGSKVEKVKRQGIEVMVAVDVSNSMLAEDMAPNRMARAKQTLSRVIDQLGNDKVGLVVFAGDSYVQMPMTTDGNSAKMFLSSINPGMVPIQGTAIGSAIRMSMSLFSEESEVGRAIVIITDGENHEDNAVELAKLAHEHGITVNVLGVGTPGGSPIPVEGTNSFKKDRDGNIIVTRLNEQMCQEIAQAGGGIYVRADNASSAARALSKELDNLTKSDVESEVYSNFNEQYGPFAWIVLLLILAEVCLMDRRNPRLKGVKLF